MNKLTFAKRVQIISMLVDGSSMRSISRVAEVSINTVTKLLVDAGKACEKFHDQQVRDVSASRVQCDELWSFCYPKSKNGWLAKNGPSEAGDVWTWTALDSDSKMILSWLVGGRDAGFAMEFMNDLKEQLAHHAQLTTDGHRAYLNAVWDAFGADVDYAQLVKMYGEPKKQGPERKYSPSVCNGASMHPDQGHPDHAHISISHVERHHLTMRMSMHRFTRLTNAFSKKIENHCHALALYFVFYNFVKIHKSLRVTPAMAAGVSKKLWKIEDIIALIDQGEVSTNRGPYKKRNSN